MKKSPYKLLSKRINGAFYNHQEISMGGVSCANGTCPAILQRNSDTIIIGHEVDVKSSDIFGKYANLIGQETVVVKIGSGLMNKAIEELQSTARAALSLGQLYCLDNKSGCVIAEELGSYIVIGSRMTAGEVAEMESYGQVGVYKEEGEVAIKIPTPLFAQAVDNLMGAGV